MVIILFTLILFLSLSGQGSSREKNFDSNKDFDDKRFIQSKAIMSSTNAKTEIKSNYSSWRQ